MTKVSAEMKAIDLNAQYLGISRLQLMENAGRAVAEELIKRFKSDTRVAVYAGLGGNGGDGLVVARHLASFGFHVTVVLAGKPENILDKETRKNWEIIRALDKSITLYVVEDSSLIPKIEADVIIDALLGIGFKGELRPPILQLTRAINRSKAFKIAIDVPTGLDVDTGTVSKGTVKADLTITLHKMKDGLEKAKRYAGEILVKSIGIPYEAELYAGPGDVYLIKKYRPPEAHKGQFGKLLIIGGSETYSGAPAFVALAALRTGIDLTYIAAPEKTAHSIASMSPNFITIKLEGTHLCPENIGEIESIIDRVDAVAIGPGLGLHKDTINAVKMIIPILEKKGIPTVIDADGLKAYATFKRKLRMPSVLTPHAGEFKLLEGKLPGELNKRIESVKEKAKEFNACILLKGPIDIISDGIQVKLNRTGNPGMTVGGTGDVLTGIVGALLSQKFDVFHSAVASAFINGAAGDFAVEEKGYHIVPTDLLKFIPKVIEDPMSHLKVKRF